MKVVVLNNKSARFISIKACKNRAENPRAKENDKKEDDDIPDRMDVVGHSTQIHGLRAFIVFQHFFF